MYNIYLPVVLNLKYDLHEVADTINKQLNYTNLCSNLAENRRPFWKGSELVSVCARKALFLEPCINALHWLNRLTQPSENIVTGKVKKEALLLWNPIWFYMYWCCQNQLEGYITLLNKWSTDDNIIIHNVPIWLPWQVHLT